MAESQGILNVNVVTPTGSIASDETDAVTAPGELGEFEVLPGHIPFLTALHPGVLTLGERQQTVYAVGPGFVRVSPDGAVEVLVESCVVGSDVDVSEAQADLAAATGELDGWDQDPNAEWKNLKARADWAQARLDAHANTSN